MGLYVFCRKCDYQIPAALQCRGTNNPAHRDLWFRTCNNCGDFLWIPPPSPSDDPYAINPGQGPGANDPFPRNEAFRSPSPGLLAIDPALQDHPSGPSIPSAVPPTDLSKRSCSRRNCKRLANAKNCTHAMCKQCCQERNGDCAYGPHRSSTPTNAANGNPSALSRPPAVIPSTSTSASSLSIDGTTAPSPSPKIYRKPMDDAWASQYKEGLSAQQRRKEAEDQKRLDDGKEPEHLRDQDVPRHPYYNLSESAGMLRKMKLDREDEVGIYNFAGRMWCREDVNTTLRLVPGQTILIKRLDVTNCNRIDEMISLHGPSGKLGKTKRKPDHEREPSGRVVQAPRTTRNHPRPVRSLTSSPDIIVSSSRTTRDNARPPHSRASSPDIILSSPSSFPSPSNLLSLSSHRSSSSSQYVDLTESPPASPQSRPHSRSLAVVIKTETDVLDSADDLWKVGRVLVPSGFGTWPAGIATRDMAWAFGRISSGGRSSDSDVKSRFNRVFPGVPYKKQTYCRQLQFWRDSSQLERDMASKLPRDDGTGRWTTWRQRCSGMTKFKNKKKAKQEEI
ncbi:hypothetical protein B0H11DRAFT_2188931 [Mycena galericulata]|nr:hypothetical protein B0H11DRAFT_2188931 [Mycena galericulata]